MVFIKGFFFAFVICITAEQQGPGGQMNWGSFVSS